MNIQPKNSAAFPQEGNVVTVPSGELDANFWRFFYENFWEKKPCVIRGASIVETDKIAGLLFEGVTAEHPLNGPVRPKFRFFREGSKIDRSDRHKFIPSGKDQSLSNYLQRLDETLDGERFELIINDTESASFPIYDLGRRFVSPFSQMNGIPQGGFSVTSFIRTYSATSFGIHKDFAALFAMVLIGDRTIYTWPVNYFPDEASGRAAKLEDHIENAEILNGKPGDIIYWPSSDWHVGANKAELAVSMHIGANYRTDTRVPFLEMARQEAKKHNQKRADYVNFKLPASENSISDAHGIPASMRNLIDAAQASLTSPEMLEQFSLRWLRMQSSSGFCRPPEVAITKPANENTLFEANPEFPILYKHTSDGKLVCACNGHFVNTLPIDQVLELITKLNSGAKTSASGFLQSSSGPLKSEHIVSLLQQLEAAYAIKRV